MDCFQVRISGVSSSLPHHLTAPPLPDKKALVLLKERVDKAADPKTELDAIVKRIKGNTNRERLPSSTFSAFMHVLRAMCVNALYCAARPRGVLALRTPPSGINRGDLRLEEQLSVPCRSLPACPPPPSHAIGPLQNADPHEFAALMWYRAWRSWGASRGSFTCAADFWACAQ